MLVLAWGAEHSIRTYLRCALHFKVVAAIPFGLTVPDPHDVVEMRKWGGATSTNGNPVCTSHNNKYHVAPKYVGYYVDQTYPGQLRVQKALPTVVRVVS